VSRGPGTNEEQISALRARLSTEAAGSAAGLVRDYEADVIALAYGMTQRKKKPPKRVRDLIEKFIAEDGDYDNCSWSNDGDILYWDEESATLYTYDPVSRKNPV
jgi:hypothetical protein